ncbi:hypothetical protein SAMN05421821_10998 [Mucilaginibacter lappiensis]|uniref:Uncharacterized protein n=1 Tax=Mucilaginibacter lappiensis TaxID=354630 RepID=A0ABR6PM89_9SPHI|nr:DUF6624 domain-containing protein [Mucilaginibacter lappiensis]MBB6110888.1 hypothetical protein [Mucilaginibacter lappiensis]SIR61372.1 hypothetical protein SAMN05421821_10998 [Mucilaginibacter lappiensis]
MKMKHIYLVLILVFLRLMSMAQVNSFTIDSSKFNKPVMLMLDTIYKDDQGGRVRMGEISKSKASEAQIDSARKALRAIDAKNLVKVRAIINKYGWLGPQDVGMNSSQGLFLTIQHADLATQEEYLPMVKKAVKDGKTLSSNLALLEDRVAMRQGKKQIYGSQLFTNKATGKLCFYPIEDPDHVDERRKTVDLQPIAEYAKVFNLTWDITAYKNSLPEIEKAAKEQKL